MERNETAAMFVAVSEALPPVTDDDCNVILQDWDDSDPDQRVAIRLAAELLRARTALREAWAMLTVGHDCAAKLGELQEAGVYVPQWPSRADANRDATRIADTVRNVKPVAWPKPTALATGAH
jgi:hypothetical protein